MPSMENSKTQSLGLAGAFQVMQNQIIELRANLEKETMALDKKIHDIQLTEGPKGEKGEIGKTGKVGALGLQGQKGKDTDIKALQLQNDINKSIAEKITKLSDDIKDMDYSLCKHGIEIDKLKNKKSWWRFW